jgi:hypothetical protein
MIATETSKDISVNGIRVTCYSDGSVESHGRWSRGRLFGGDDGRGYQKMKVGSQTVKVHDLVAMAFIGPKPKNYDVDHINGDRLDNSPANLRYVTRSQNLRGYQKVRGKCKYRGVQVQSRSPKFIVKINLGKKNNYKQKYLGSFADEREAAIVRDTFCYEELKYPLEGLNFPELFVDKEKASAQVQRMQDTEENIERIQTQIDMIRQESRLLSYRIDRMTEQRKELQDEKRNLKDLLTKYKNP